MICQK